MDSKGHEGLLFDVFCSWVLGMWVSFLFFFMFFFPIDFFLLLRAAPWGGGGVCFCSLVGCIVGRNFFSLRRGGIVLSFVFSMARWS